MRTSKEFFQQKNKEAMDGGCSEVFVPMTLVDIQDRDLEILKCAAQTQCHHCDKFGITTDRDPHSTYWHQVPPSGEEPGFSAECNASPILDLYWGKNEE